MPQTTEQQELLKQLQMSQTISQIANLAKTMPINVNDHEQLHAALSVSSLTLINALDNDRIQFKNLDDKAMLYALLTVVFELQFNGKLTDCIQTITPKQFN